MTKNETIKYLFEKVTNKVKDTKTGIIYYAIHTSAATNVVLDINVYNSFPDSTFEIL